ncbi:unnamed protein product, partial [Ectocarpus sp. 8 AP-2014]
MLGWINKKIATAGAGGGTGSGQGGGNERGGRASTDDSGKSQKRNDPQRDLPANPPRQQGQPGRRGSFFDAMGGAMTIGRGGGRGKKDDKSEAAALAEQLDAQRAERISCVAFKLVREI